MYDNVIKKNNIKGAIFDLDGVLVDTAKYHYKAWKQIANELGFDFTEKDNERLKGVSRMNSLEILLEIGGISLQQTKKQELAERKNQIYVSYISQLNADEILPGSVCCLERMKQDGIGIALGSASKNARFILDKLGISNYFNVIIDGFAVKKTKPDPEVFILAAKGLNLEPNECVVFEDSQSGIDAAKIAGMFAVGIGNSENLKGYDVLIKCLDDLS